ncbi:MAG TPA: hypothetical protein VMF13_03450 [Luteitalea sp.]|nr:hypothetical protein [Luteitalea sp.]
MADDRWLFEMSALRRAPVGLIPELPVMAIAPVEVLQVLCDLHDDAAFCQATGWLTNVARMQVLEVHAEGGTMPAGISPSASARVTAVARGAVLHALTSTSLAECHERPVLVDDTPHVFSDIVSHARQRLESDAEHFEALLRDVTRRWPDVTGADSDTALDATLTLIAEHTESQDTDAAADAAFCFWAHVVAVAEDGDDRRSMPGDTAPQDAQVVRHLRPRTPTTLVTENRWLWRRLERVFLLARRVPAFAGHRLSLARLMDLKS